jgi:hypothetical protein
MMTVLTEIASELGLRMYLDAHPYEVDQSEKTGIPKEPLKAFYRTFGFKDASKPMRLNSGYYDLMIREAR